MGEKKKLEDSISLFMKDCLAFQEKLYERVKIELKCLPEGSINRKNINGKVYYYHNTKDDNGTRIQKCISSKERILIQDLIKKQRYRDCEIYLRKNLPILRSFNKKYRPAPSEFRQDASSVMHELVFFNNEEIKRWKLEDFKGKKRYEEDLIQTTVTGSRVRSKSEVIIAGMLESKGVPFRYEAELKLGGISFHPDFTILCPKSGNIIYWEHFGMMNDPKYFEQSKNKIQIYFEHGILPCDRLILTYDNADGSIDAKLILSLIESIASR